MRTQCRGRVWLPVAAASLAAVLGAGPAHGHPFEDGLAGHRLRLTVRADAVEVDLLVEEPVPWVLRDLRTFLAGVEQPGPADQERYDARRLDEFESGLQLFLDGERTAWERLPWDGDNGVGDRQFVIYGLRLRAPLDPDRVDVSIHLLDAVHPDARVARMTEVWGSWDTDLRGCSLWAEGDGDQSGEWTLGDPTAELRLTRRVPATVPAVWSRLGLVWRTGSEDPVRVGAAGIAGPVDARLAVGVAGGGGLLFLAAVGTLVVRRRTVVGGGGPHL